MPQFDFRQLFPSDPTETHPRKECLGAGDDLTDSQKFSAPAHLSRSNWANIAFVAAACLGALISALYLFNGGELFRQAAMWPGELLYSPPRSHPRTYPSSTPQKSVPAQIVNESAPSAGNAGAKESGDPFSSTNRLLHLNQTPLLATPRTNPANSSAPLAAPHAPSVLNQLGLGAPGGDALSRALTNGPITAAEPKVASAATNSVNAVQAQSQRITSSGTKKNARSARRFASRAKVSHAGQSTKRSTQSLRTTTAKTSRGHSSLTKSTAQSTSARSMASGVHQSNVGQGAGLKTLTSPSQQFRAMGGGGAMGAGGGHLMGHPGGR